MIIIGCILSFDVFEEPFNNIDDAAKFLKISGAASPALSLREIKKTIAISKLTGLMMFTDWYAK